MKNKTTKEAYKRKSYKHLFAIGLFDDQSRLIEKPLPNNPNIKNLIFKTPLEAERQRNLIKDQKIKDASKVFLYASVCLDAKIEFPNAYKIKNFYNIDNAIKQLQEIHNNQTE